ncbi:MAG: AsmA family protein [Plesiomonas sp.]|uniref:AsmA family protein n=1 Tax=Plesiomonas sp. TaxID=2486279 RepID=UPI003F320D01
MAYHQLPIMKILTKFLATLLILFLLVIILAYALLQTPLGAERVSRWISAYTPYQLSLTGIQHSPLSPRQIRLTEVRLAQQGTPLLDARQVTLTLNLRTLLHPLHWQKILLQEGELRLPALLKPASGPFLYAQQLQLDNMAISSRVADIPLTAHPVNGGITPFNPDQQSFLGENARFELSSPQFDLGELTLNNLFLQGHWQQGKLSIDDFGADTLQGQITAAAERSTQGAWTINALRLTRLRLQDNRLPALLSRYWQILPPLTLQRADIVGARVEGNDWSVNDLDLSLNNLQIGQGTWSSHDGQLSMNALDLVRGDLHLREPALRLSFTADGITIDDFSTRFENGLINGYGSWRAADQTLQWDQLGISGIEYSIPATWAQWLTHPLPAVFSQINVLKLELNNNLLVDINPLRPFQFTALNANGSNLQLAQQQHWGLWRGSLRASARAATVNKVDMRNVAVDLQADNGAVTLRDFSAFTGKGLLEGSGTLLQRDKWPASLQLSGQQIALDSLQQWGWQTLPLRGIGNLNLNLQANLLTADNVRQSLSGELQLTTEQALLRGINALSLWSQAQRSPIPDQWIAQSTLEGQQTLLKNLQLHLRAEKGQIWVQNAAFSGDQLQGKISGSYSLAPLPLSPTAEPNRLQLQFDNRINCQRLTRIWHSPLASIATSAQNAVNGSDTTADNEYYQSSSSVSGVPECVPAGSTI